MNMLNSIFWFLRLCQNLCLSYQARPLSLRGGAGPPPPIARNRSPWRARHIKGLQKNSVDLFFLILFLTPPLPFPRL